MDDNVSVGAGTDRGNVSMKRFVHDVPLKRRAEGFVPDAPLHPGDLTAGGQLVISVRHKSYRDGSTNIVLSYIDSDGTLQSLIESSDLTVRLIGRCGSSGGL